MVVERDDGHVPGSRFRATLTDQECRDIDLWGLEEKAYYDPWRPTQHIEFLNANDVQAGLLHGWLGSFIALEIAQAEEADSL